jgi:hypothetical protein
LFPVEPSPPGRAIRVRSRFRGAPPLTRGWRTGRIETRNSTLGGAGRCNRRKVRACRRGRSASTPRFEFRRGPGAWSETRGARHLRRTDW